MIYTYKRGVDRQLKERAIKSGGIVLPIVSLLFLIIAALSFSLSKGSGQSPSIPTKSPAHVAAASHNQKPKGSASPSNQPSPASSSSSTTASTPIMSPGSLGGSPTQSTGVASISPTSVTGGMGGGDLTSSGSSPSGSTSGTSGGSTTTIACSNTLTTTQLCTVCVPPLLLQPGQKALLSSDGTCVAVN